MALKLQKSLKYIVVCIGEKKCSIFGALVVSSHNLGGYIEWRHLTIVHHG